MRQVATGLTILSVIASLGRPAAAQSTGGRGSGFSNRDLHGEYVFALTLAQCREPRVGATCTSAYCRYSGLLEFDGVDTVILSQLVYCTDEVPTRTFSSHPYWVGDDDGTFQVDSWFSGQILGRNGPLVLRATVDVGGEGFVFYGVATRE